MPEQTAGYGGGSRALVSSRAPATAKGKADRQQELLYGPGRPELLTFQENPETQVLIGILFLNISN